MTETTDQSAAARRIQAAVQAVQAAEAGLKQSVRDAHAGGETITDIARALGVKNRQRVYDILDRDADGDPSNPPPRPVVYLRGARMPADAWWRVEEAMWARGWSTTRDRTAAWHLARGGVPVVFCDFSAPELDSDDQVVVARVRARYEEHQQIQEIQDLLTSEDTAHLIRQNAGWMHERVTVTSQDMDLSPVTGGRWERPKRANDTGGRILDEDALARLVAEQLGVMA